MSSQPMPTVVDPVFRGKMPLLDGTIASTGLSKPQNMSGFLGKQMLQYGGAYFTYDPRGKDTAGFTSWSNSKTSLVAARSPVSPLSGMDRQNHIIYRQDSNSSEEGHCHSSPLYHARVKPGFTLFAKSPGISSPIAGGSAAQRKPKTGGENLSPPSENAVYLAIPKPVYVHNPCCNELGCVMTQRYSLEQGSPRMPNTVYEHDWMQTDSHYTERPPIQRKAQDSVPQQRGLQMESSAERLKRMTDGTWSPGRTRTFPGRIDPKYSSYPCTPTHTLLGSPSEHSQHLQTSPRGYPSLYPSHPVYEHMTSEVYREHSPMTKYGQLPQHPMFYYAQANAEVENGTPFKQREDVPVIVKHTLPNTREHYIGPPLFHGEIPLPGTETLPNHALMQAFDYSYYAVPRFNLNTSQLRAPLKRQHGSPGVNYSPSSQYVEHPMASATNLHNEKTNSSLRVGQPHTNSPLLRVDQTNSPLLRVDQTNSPLLRVDQTNSPLLRGDQTNSPLLRVDQTNSPLLRGDQTNSPLLRVDQTNSPLLRVDQTNSPLLRVDQTSPARRGSQAGVSPSSIQTNRFFHPLNSLHIDRPVFPPTGSDRRMDYSAYDAQVTCPKMAKSLPVSPAAWPPRSPHHSSDRVQAAVPHCANVRKIIYSPAVAIGNKQDGSVSSSGPAALKEGPKRRLSKSPPPIKIKEEDRDLCEVELHKKRQRVKMANGEVGNKTDSPPMPVIDNVFSLAPYKVYLQAPGELFPGRISQSAEQRDNKTKMDIKAKMPNRGEQQSVLRLVSRTTSAGIYTEKKHAEEIFEPQNIKVEEKVYPLDPDGSSKTPDGERYCSKLTIKRETEETSSCNSEPMLVIKKCEPDELESKPPLADEKVTSDESKPGEVTAPICPENSSSPPDVSTPPAQLVVLQPKPVTPPQPPESKLDFRNIPPQSLKLSTYKLFFCDSKQSSPAPAQPITQVLVRKHFFEMHHALCKLVSDLVLASSKQELRTWLSQVGLTEAASPPTKVQKVSCLLGVKAREVWLNEEMKSALHTVLERMREYTAQDRCPFPHVMRTGAVFLPMLVVKELLFPTVQGSFIDQVLQEHRVELRPTTLSEEKLLVQFHKRACSSRLRRLMSLKHLPDIYADVVNLLYHTCVCKHLGLEVDDSDDGETDDGGKGTPGRRSPAFSDDITASPSESHQARRLEDHHKNPKRRKSRVKTSSRRMFLDNSLSEKEEADDPKPTAGGGALESLSGHQCEDKTGSDRWVSEQDSSLIPLGTTLEKSWMCPITCDRGSPSPSDTEAEELSSPQRPVGAKSPDRSKNCSGVILKLRRMFRGLNRKRVCYQAVSSSGSLADASHAHTDDGGGAESGETRRRGRTPRATHRWRRTGSFPHALRPLHGSSKRKHRSVVKIKYCPYLSTCHSPEYRRRWVLRSAVQRAMSFYPDLVGKKIRHLYEEVDKSEVWYRGEVLRVHEAHANPLKTLFEVRYDSEPEWRYYLELLMDYKKGWLKIEDENNQTNV